MQTRLPKILLSHYDCGAITENTLYALNHVQQCHNTPEELETSQTKTILFTKYFRKELNATECRIQHQREKWHCGQNDHSSIDMWITSGITSDLVISPERCRSPAKGKMIYLADLFSGVEYDTKNPIVITDGSRVMIKETTAPPAVGLPGIPSPLICNEQH